MTTNQASIRNDRSNDRGRVPFQRKALRPVLLALATVLAFLSAAPSAASAAVVGPSGTVYESYGFCWAAGGGSLVGYSGISSMPATYVRVMRYDYSTGQVSSTPWSKAVTIGDGFVVAPTTASPRWHALYIQYAAQNGFGKFEFKGEWVTFANSYWCNA